MLLSIVKVHVDKNMCLNNNNKFVEFTRSMLWYYIKDFCWKTQLLSNNYQCDRIASIMVATTNFLFLQLLNTLKKVMKNLSSNHPNSGVHRTRPYRSNVIYCYCIGLLHVHWLVEKLEVSCCHVYISNFKQTK